VTLVSCPEKQANVEKESQVRSWATWQNKREDWQVTITFSRKAQITISRQGPLQLRSAQYPRQSGSSLTPIYCSAWKALVESRAERTLNLQGGSFYLLWPTLEINVGLIFNFIVLTTHTRVDKARLSWVMMLRDSLSCRSARLSLNATALISQWGSTAER